MYSLEVREHLNKILKKLAKKDYLSHAIIEKKTEQILQDPHHYKPLHKPMQHMHRVHILNSSVLVFSIDEKRKVVILEDYDHHDHIYK
jgi:YafQ family addiction module toxin component